MQITLSKILSRADDNHNAKSAPEIKYESRENLLYSILPWSE